MEFSLLGSAAIAVTCFWGMLRWEAPRGNAAGCTVDLWDVGVTAAIAGVFIGRLAAMVNAGIAPWSDPGQIILVRGGVSTTAAALGAIGVFAIMARRDLPGAADAIAPSALAGLAGWHAGCVTSTSCLGTESSLPWAFGLPGSPVTRHPVEIYAAIALGIGAMALAAWKRRGRPPRGTVAGVALVIAGGVRLATEPLRVSLDGGPTPLYAIGVVAGAVIVAGAVARERATRTAPPVDPGVP